MHQQQKRPIESGKKNKFLKIISSLQRVKENVMR